jgi:flavorubredoxin
VKIKYKKEDLSKKPVLLFSEDKHEIYWIGAATNTTLRNNIYLIRDGLEAMIIDCGSGEDFKSTLSRVKKIIPVEYITRIFANHQDPDVTSGIKDWLELNPKIEVLASPFINIFIEHYLGNTEYKYFNVEEKKNLKLSSGAILEFIPSPFMHSPGAVAIYDHKARVLFSGDIWASIAIEWDLVMQGDFKDYIEFMDFFHKKYISSNKASKSFLAKLKDKKIDAIFPQHGSIITGRKNIKNALRYIRDLKCGIDFFEDVGDKELEFIEEI